MICVLDFTNDLTDSDNLKLALFNNETTVLNEYKFDDMINATVKFDTEVTDKEIFEFFELEKNATHVLFKKRLNVSVMMTREFLQKRFDEKKRSFFKFGIELFNK